MIKIATKLSIIILSVFFLEGCSSFVQIYYLDSKDVDKVNENFVFENDTVKISYFFWAKRGVLAFEIYNKLEKPLYVDWKKSSYIYKDEKLNFWDETEKVTTLGVSRNYLYSGTVYINDRPSLIEDGIYASASKKEKPERITFIPPKSSYSRSQFHILNFDGHTLPTNLPIQNVVSVNTTLKVYNYNVTRLDSLEPNKLFRNFLTFSLTEDIKDEFYVDNGFFIKSITELSAEDFATAVGNNLNKNDKFFVEIPDEKSIYYRK